MLGPDRWHLSRLAPFTPCGPKESIYHTRIPEDPYIHISLYIHTSIFHHTRIQAPRGLRTRQLRPTKGKNDKSDHCTNISEDWPLMGAWTVASKQICMKAWEVLGSRVTQQNYTVCDMAIRRFNHCCFYGQNGKYTTMHVFMKCKYTTDMQNAYCGITLRCICHR